MVVDVVGVPQARLAYLLAAGLVAEPAGAGPVVAAGSAGQQGDAVLLDVAAIAGSVGVVGDGEPQELCVPKTSSASCDQPIFVDQASDASVSSDTVLR